MNTKRDESYLESCECLVPHCVSFVSQVAVAHWLDFPCFCPEFPGDKNALSELAENECDSIKTLFFCWISLIRYYASRFYHMGGGRCMCEVFLLFWQGFPFRFMKDLASMFGDCGALALSLELCLFLILPSFVGPSLPWIFGFIQTSEDFLLILSLTATYLLVTLIIDRSEKVRFCLLAKYVNTH